MNVTQPSAQTASWIEKTARLGFASKGLVYVIVGFLTAKAATGRGGENAGSSSALNVLLAQPFGRILLAFVAVGLVGYAVWRLLDASRGTSSHHDGGAAVRAFTALKGIVYGALGLESARMAIKGASNSDSANGSAQHWTARLMNAPFGPYLLLAVGIGIAVYGLYQIYNAWRSKLSKDLSLSQLDARTQRAIVAISRFGIAARGVVFAILGYFLVTAALHRNANEARGMGGALSSVQDERFGATMLLVIAIGLIGYGFYEFVNSRYRRVQA